MRYRAIASGIVDKMLLLAIDDQAMSRSFAIVEAAEKLIRESRAGRMPINQICKALCISQNVFRAAVRTACGESAYQHLQGRRLDWVREALLAASGPPPLIKA